MKKCREEEENDGEMGEKKATTHKQRNKSNLNKLSCFGIVA